MPKPKAQNTRSVSCTQSAKQGPVKQMESSCSYGHGYYGY